MRTLADRRIFAAVGIIVWLAASPLLADAPAGYYDAVNDTDAASLRLTLHDAIDDHTRFPYTDDTTDTWDILNLADEDPADGGRILDVYKNASYAKIPGGVGAYNREHSWPKSYGFPDLVVANSAYTDCHHLFASDADYNGWRSNKPYRWCHAGCQEWATERNDGRGGGAGIFPGNGNWTTGSFTAGTWETWDGRKGDVARALLYMDIRYEGGLHGVTGRPEPDLTVTDDEGLIAGSNTGANEDTAYMGLLSVLLDWHHMDPVDGRERRRNDVVFGFQGNRNPFIDHPEWVDCLHRGLCGGSADLTPPAAPTGLVAHAGAGGVELMWNAGADGDLAGYHVYRAAVSGGPYARITGAVVATAFYTDTTAGDGGAFYVVRAADARLNLSEPSAEATSGGGCDPPPGGNQLPAVVIDAPTDGASFTTGAMIDFRAAATDPEDGDLTAALGWTSNLDGALGGGGAFSRSLSEGTHIVTAAVTDACGLGASAAVTVTVGGVSCVPDGRTACLLDGRFQVEGTMWDFNTPPREFAAEVMDFSGQRAESDQAVFFASFSPGNFEVGVKMVDGCGLPDGHPLRAYWAFFGGLTNAETAIEVKDTVTGDLYHWSNSAGSFPVTLGDSTAFPCVEGPPLSQCIPGVQTACLLGERFRVTGTMFDFSSPPKEFPTVVMAFPGGRAESDQAVFFESFTRGNFEIGVKMVNACAFPDGHPLRAFWVFYGGLTNAETEIRVTQVSTGQIDVWRNPAGVFPRSEGRTSAFPCE